MKHVFLGILFIFINLGLHAQGRNQDIKIGAKAGANFYDAANNENKTGLLTGAFIKGFINNKIAIQVEALFSKEGAKLNNQKLKIDYIRLPVLVKYYLVKGINIQGGPQFGFVVNDNITKVLGNLFEAEDIDITGNIEIGIDLPFDLSIDVRYNFGLSDVVKNGNVGKNQVFSVTLACAFLNK